MINTVKSQFKKQWLLIYALLTSALVLLFCSKSSPLYPMNDWVDVQCFLTLGKGLLNGMIPYVDLYEQKGPVLYFIYAIVALFSQKSMFGQYLLELVTFGLFLYFSAKLAGIYIGKKSKWLYLIIPVLAMIVGTTKSFRHGGSVEQMCLFMFVYGLYSVLNAFHEDRPLTFRTALINGILAGMVFWIKYTMFGFYMGLALFVLIWYLISIRDWKKTIAVIGQFLLGFGIVSAMVVAFFLCAGGLKELYTCYFYNNIFLYNDASDTGTLLKIWNGFVKSMTRNAVFPIFLYIGMGWLILQNKKRVLNLVAVLLPFLGLCVGTFMGANYIYYGLVLCAFMVFGLIAVVQLVRSFKLTALFNKIADGSRFIIGTVITTCFLLCVIGSFGFSSNTYLMCYERQEMPQYRFAEIINQTENPTLLNMGFLDGGFYYAADVVPNCRYFCYFNIDTSEMFITQYNHANEGKADYVVTRDHPLREYIYNHDQYELVDTAVMYFEGLDFTYYLYRLKGVS